MVAYALWSIRHGASLSELCKDYIESLGNPKWPIQLVVRKVIGIDMNEARIQTKYVRVLCERAKKTEIAIAINQAIKHAGAAKSPKLFHTSKCGLIRPPIFPQLYTEFAHAQIIPRIHAIKLELASTKLLLLFL